MRERTTEENGVLGWEPGGEEIPQYIVGSVLNVVDRRACAHQLVNELHNVGKCGVVVLFGERISIVRGLQYLLGELVVKDS